MRVQDSRLCQRPMLLGCIWTAIGRDAVVSDSPGGCRPHISYFGCHVFHSCLFRSLGTTPYHPNSLVRVARPLIQLINMIDTSGGIGAAQRQRLGVRLYAVVKSEIVCNTFSASRGGGAALRSGIVFWPSGWLNHINQGMGQKIGRRGRACGLAWPG